MDNFVHLHLHTECSLLDGACKISDVIGRVKELGQTAVAITDHGVMYGVVDFYKEAISVGIKPIIGCEVYTAPRGMTDKNFGLDSDYGHLCLLAENNVGYRNLVKIVTAAQLDGFYYKPRVDFELLNKYSEGIIALSACMAGDIPKALQNSDKEKAERIANRFIEIFGRDNFYIELQNQGVDGQNRLNFELSALADRLGLETVATNDVHYVKKEDAGTQDLLLCIQMGKNVSDPDRMKFETDEFYIKSGDEMKDALPGYRKALENTRVIADRCNVTFDFSKTHLPKFDLPEGIDAFNYLKNLAYSGAKTKYGEVTADIATRLDFELETIRDMGFVDYFLIVWDFVKYAKSVNIPVGPGRGSAAGSIVSYCLDITTVDPVKYNLLFERFLNPERVTMPDIDIDFCFERRGEVIDYVIRKYGEERVTQIITFGTLAARAAVRDAGRALDIPIPEVDRVAKLIPRELNITLPDAVSREGDLKKLYESDLNARNLIDAAMPIEGMMRHASTHAAGIVIYKTSADNYLPLQRQGDFVTTQFAKETVEELGLLKMDFLGLKNLTIIQKAVDMIYKNHGVKVDIENIDLNDPDIYRYLQTGETDGLFQLESRGMRQFLRELKPDCFEDVIAAISLYRPGPMASIPTYIRNKNHPQNVKYSHHLLSDILKPTYGCIVYQEQVMQICQSLAGYSLGRADIVRRAMAKKKKDVLMREKELFIYGGDGVDGCIKRGVPKDTAEKIFNEILDFASYAFNKSHAAAYAVVACRTAWLKAKYPTEFMTALVDISDNITPYFPVCQSMGIKILPPHINRSFEGFVSEGRNIRFGLGAIKNIGTVLASKIVDERNRNGEFESFRDFTVRLSDINKRASECLIRCGVFDSFGNKRSQLVGVSDLWLDEAQLSRRSMIEGQISLFGDDEADLTLPDLPEYSLQDKLSMEYELTGIYLSGHPLSEYRASVRLNADTEISSIGDEDSGKGDGSRVRICGIISFVRVKNTRGGSKMAYVQISDFGGTVEAVIFPRTFSNASSFITVGTPVVADGTVNISDDGVASVNVSVIRVLNKIPFKEGVRIVINTDSSHLQGIANVCKKYSGGETEIFIQCRDDLKWRAIKGTKAVFCTDDLITLLKREIADGNIEIISV